MKDFTKIFIALVVIVAFFTFFKKDEALVVPNRAAEPVEIKTTEPGAIEQAYMGGCLDGSGGDSVYWETYCQCTYDYMDDRLTNDQFVDMAIEYADTGIDPLIMDQAVNYCL